MGTDQLDIVRRQAEAVVKKQVSREKAKIRRETSLVKEMSLLSRKAGRMMDTALDEAEGILNNRKHKIISGAEGMGVQNGETVVLADGYVRRSPVQSVYTPPGYRKRIYRRAFLLAAAVVLLMIVFWLLVHYSVISI